MRTLFLQKRLLFPADVGGKIRTLNVLKHIANWQEITYLCNQQPGEEPYLDQMQDLGLRMETIPWRETPRGTFRFYGQLAANLFSRNPYNVDKDYDKRLRRRAEILLADEDYDLLICDFVQMARNAIGLRVPKILFQHNVEAEIFKRHAQHDSGWLRRKYMEIQWKKMQRFESRSGTDFDCVVAVSRKDQAMFEGDYGWRHVRVIDTAVDLDYFHPQSRTEPLGNVVFVGSMDWLPNEGGVIRFVRRIWPQIRHEFPRAQFQVVGRNPTPKVLALKDEPSVEVVGSVPDVRPYLAQASVVVVPLYVGGGTRLKIFEAMASQRAVVSTALGAEGLPVRPGEHCLIADTDEDFARSVVRVLQEDSLRDALALQGRRLVESKYSAEAVARQFDQICRETVDRSGQRFARRD